VREKAPDGAGDCGPEIELGTLGEEICCDVFENSRQASGPAEHAHLVVIAVADDIGAGFDQKPHECLPLPMKTPMNWTFGRP
jgi:hypothetical protein